MSSNGVEIGAAWIKEKQDKTGNYVSVSLADPAFGKLYANLGKAAGQDDEDVFALIWNPGVQGLIAPPGTGGRSSLPLKNTVIVLKGFHKNAMTFDTLAITQNLRAHGFDQQQAEAAVQAIRDAQIDLFTKQDADGLRSELKADLNRAKLEIVLAVGGMFAIIEALFKFVH